MPETTIDLKQALLIARPFNLAFNNAFMYGGSHQTTKDSAASYYLVLQPYLEISSGITVSVERGSIFIENHCVDKLLSVSRIVSRCSKTGVQSVTFDRDASVESVQAFFYVMGAIADFTNVDSMQAHFIKERIYGVKINYVVYQKVTLDDKVVNKSETTVQADPDKILKELSEILSLHSSASNASETGAGIGVGTGSGAGVAGVGGGVAGGTGGTEAGSGTPGAFVTVDISQTDYNKFISNQINSFNNQLAASEHAVNDDIQTPVEMLESIYKLKEKVLENLKLQRATGKLTSAEELVVDKINQLSYQVIVRLIKEEYRNDRTISIKRLAQIIRRMLPDLKELKFLLPQLKDGLFAEGMSPSEYLSLVKELNNELDSEGLMQVLIEASDQVGLTFNELLEGIKGAPEEAAKLIVLAAEIKKGGVNTDDEQMSAVLSDYIEKVSRSLALQSPEIASSGGGKMLKSAVTRIEREILDRLKSQNVASNTIAGVAEKLASQFAETISVLQGDWVRANLNKSDKLNEEMLLSIIEQVAEQGQGGITGEIRTILISNGYSADSIDTIVKNARSRAIAAITHTIEIPPGVYNDRSTIFFLDREIRLNLRYNTPFSTVLISYEEVVDIRTFTLIDITPDIHIQLTNQALNFLKEIQKRDLDVIGICSINTTSIPFMVLPMTDVSGAIFVKKRLDTDFPQHEFLVNDISVHVVPKVTVSDFNKNLTPDKASYLKAIYRRHSQPKFH